jgi:hypothetical protein
MTTDWPTVAIPTTPRSERVGLARELLTFEELMNLPPVSPLIEDTLPLGGVSLLAGRYGTAKSFLALSMGLSVATGSPWYGREVEQKRTLYVAAEGVQGMGKRVQAWRQSTGVTFGYEFEVLRRPVQLGVPKEFEELREMVAREGFGFVIIDTLAKSSLGLEENSNSDMSRAIDSLYKLRDATGDGSVLVVHHTGKDGTTIRGASALEAGVDVVYLTTEKDQSYLMERKKNKDGPVVDKRVFQLVTPEGAYAPVLSTDISTDTAGKTQELLSVMSNECRNGAGILQSELRALSGMESGTFTYAKNKLIEKGLIVAEGENRATVLYLKGDEPF